MSFLIQIVDFIDQGGLISWILTVLYFFVMTLTLERIIFFLRTSCNFSYLDGLVKKANSIPDLLLLQKNTYLLKHQKSQNVSILLHYIDNRPLADKAFNESIERMAFGLIFDMEKRIWLISQIGHIAPLLGLLGTVVGLIESFKIMASMGASADVASFASGIWVAMITTALGLIVAIPSFFIFRIFEKVVEKRSVQMSYLVSLLNELCACDACPLVTTSSSKKNSLTEEADLNETF